MAEKIVPRERQINPLLADGGIEPAFCHPGREREPGCNPGEREQEPGPSSASVCERK
jgi:hypothetical protein